MTVSIEGKYILSKSVNFDAYLKSCGVNFVLRKLAGSLKPTLEIYEDSEGYCVWKTETPVKTIVIRFRYNEWFTMDFPDGSGRTLKALAVKEGHKVTLTQTLEGDKDQKILDVKEFTEDEMVATITYGDVTCIRQFDRMH